MALKIRTGIGISELNRESETRILFEKYCFVLKEKKL